MKKIDRLRKETYDDMMRLLNEFGKCAVIRPTGFGKTGILTKLIKSKTYNNILFLYPTEVVKDAVLDLYFRGNVPSDAKISNVTFMTYSKLINLSKQDMRDLGDIDLIICDECHRLGATRTYKAMNKLLKVFTEAHLVGATATPDRMDLIDEIGDFFGDHVVFEYTLHSAFSDGVLKRPYYCFCSYGVDDLKFVEKQTRLEVEKMDSDRDNALTLLRSRLIEISNLQRMSKIIKDTCVECSSDVSYLKFVVFFVDFAHMNDKGFDVEGWFRDAFPDHSLDVLKVSSETSEYTNNTSKLAHLTYKSNHIDLIYCVDMMNMGCHVNDLTGIVMYRGTESGIIYNQQLGRVLSSGSCKSGIVFDVVDNIHREAIYDVLGKRPKLTRRNKNRYEKLKQKQELGEELTPKEIVDLENLSKRFENSDSKWWTNCNDLEPEDLIATGHEATYRELIAKTVAEPISMRCRQAWKRWLEKGGSDKPFTREHILEQKAPKNVPLSPFCELKNVSVYAVLKEMGL